MEKYYTPNIEDLFIGYECESYNNGIWEKHTFKDIDYEGILIYLDGIWLQTPYLTKEQIQSEGWKLHDEKHNEFRKGCYVLVYRFSNQQLQIADTDSSYGWQVKFVGNCKSINELRKISKLLEI